MRKAGHRKLHSRDGYTLVEMTVCFALLGIMMVLVFRAMSSALSNYYYIRGTETAYTVADTVASNIANEIRTMQPKTNAGTDQEIVYNGYLCIRRNQVSGNQYTGTRQLQKCSAAGTTISGDCLEFVSARGKEDSADNLAGASGNQGENTGSGSGSGNYVAQIDAAGFATEEKPGAFVKVGKVTGQNVWLPQNYLTVRYYFEEDPTKRSSYGTPGSAVQTIYDDKSDHPLSDGTPVARDAEERLGTGFYGRNRILVTFSVEPKASGESSTEYHCDSVAVTVYVFRNASDLEDNWGKLTTGGYVDPDKVEQSRLWTYSKTETVTFQNNIPSGDGNYYIPYYGDEETIADLYKVP